MTDVMPEQLMDLDEVGGGEPATPATDGLDAVDEQLIARLTGKARDGGLALTGEGGLLAQLTKRLVESALDGELTDHLGYDKHDAAGRDGGNSRNGHRSKTPIANDVGVLDRMLSALARPAWEVTADDVDGVVGQLASAGRAVSTRRNYLQVFKGFHRFLQVRKAAEIEAAFGVRLACPLDEFNTARHVGDDSPSADDPLRRSG